MPPVPSASYRQSLRTLYGLQSFGIKLGLRNIRVLLACAGRPQRRFRAIHVAGTNGKGSTAALLAAILTQAGFRTALYTSPHLVDFRERMRVDGRKIPMEAVIRWSRRLMPEVRRRRATFFEAVTALAFAWFAEEGVDIAVVETGLGGRLDATNVLEPMLSIITTIGLEHTSILGQTLSAIAREKAGIIKPGTPCVCGVLQPVARAVIRRTAQRCGSELMWSTASRIRARNEDLEGSLVDVSGRFGRWRSLQVGLPGRFQWGNVKAVLASVAVLRSMGLPIPDDAVYRGMHRVAELTGVQGRLSIVRQRPQTIVDVAHNPDAMRSLADGLRRLCIHPRVAVIGVAADKDVRAIARALRGVVAQVIAVAARTPRSRPAVETAGAFRGAGFRVSVAPTVAAGVRAGQAVAGANGTLLITGSHFVAGEAVAFLERKGYLTISQ